jgi:16S rRNA (uracil1498-N3)-methyltransferase
MHHFFVSPSQIGKDTVTILGSDVNHIRNVLRMELSEEVDITDGEGEKVYHCRIEAFEEESVLLKILRTEEIGAELPGRIYLFQGLPKSDKMEWIIQKAVELGVYEIVPMAAKRSVVRLDDKKAENKRKRWQSISESAAKQSKRLVIPKVTLPMSFSEAVAYAKELDVKLIPYELEEGMERTRSLLSAVRPGQSVAVFIGPEGGFEESEVAFAKEQGFCAITLGKRILRTETAGMTVLSILMYLLEDAGR